MSNNDFPNHDDSGHHGETSVVTVSRVKKPSFYAVVMLNDDFSTMDFVISVLQKFFAKTADEAEKIMLEIHNKGRAGCGIYPYDIAHTKSNQVRDYAKQKQMPLRCIVEKA